VEDEEMVEQAEVKAHNAIRPTPRVSEPVLEASEPDEDDPATTRVVTPLATDVLERSALDALYGDGPEWDVDAERRKEHAGVRRTIMLRARPGDWLVLPPPPTGHHRRRGQVIGLLHPDGSPPYRVRWLDDDRVTVVLPPPGTRVLRHDEPVASG
jgi:hypothetical protein